MNTKYLLERSKEDLVSLLQAVEADLKQLNTNLVEEVNELKEELLELIELIEIQEIE